jgi:hypothetical protein
VEKLLLLVEREGSGPQRTPTPTTTAVGADVCEASFTGPTAPPTNAVQTLAQLTGQCGFVFGAGAMGEVE